MQDLTGSTVKRVIHVINPSISYKTTEEYRILGLLFSYLFSGGMFVVSILFFLNPGLCKGASHVLSGRVIDATTNQSLVYATVTVQNFKKVIQTNERGEFRISLPDEEVTLLVSYIGYRTERLDVHKNDSTVVVKLTPVGFLLQEVSVYAEQANPRRISSAEIKNQQIRDLAGLTKDPLRAVQLLPGVSVDNEVSNKINVRGGTSDENLILINGVEVYNPDHLKELAGGSMSIFNIDMVKSIDFSSGGFSVKYGDALSSMMKIDYKDGDRNNYQGKVDLSLIDFSVLVEGPVSRNGSFIIGVRQSYLDYLMRMLSVSSAISLDYYDVQGQMDYNLSDLNKLKVDVIFSRDNANQSPSNSYSRLGYYWNYYGQQTLVSQTTVHNSSFLANYTNSLVSIRSSNMLSDKLLSLTTASYYNEVEHEHAILMDSTSLTYSGFPQFWSYQSNNRNLIDDLSIKTICLDQDLNFQSSQFLDFDGGFTLKKILYDDAPNMHGVQILATNVTLFPDTTTMLYPPDPTYNDTVITNASTYSLAAYFQQTSQIGSNLMFNAGIRLDYFDMDKETRFAPRTSLSYAGPFGVTIRAAWGIYYEPPTYKQLRSSVASDTNTAFEKAVQYILGFEKKIEGGMDLRCEFYYKDYSSMIPTIRLSDGELAYGTRQNDAKGYATGMDLMYNETLGNTDLLLSYSYLVAREKLLDSKEGYYPRYTDQTHTLSLAVISDLGNKWSLDVRFFYGSGYAYTPYVSHYDSTAMMYLWVAGNKNASHYPPYERVDLKIAKGYSLFHKPLQIYLDVMNLFNRRNVLSYTYTYDANGRPMRRANLLYGLIPTLGVSYSF